MTRAYDELYLRDAMRNVGVMTHCCIKEYGLSPDEFQTAFLQSPVSQHIAKGNPRYLVGHSGKELATIVLQGKELARPISDTYTITPEYWAGWVLAYYQWYTSRDFTQIASRGLTFSNVLQMYNPLHEADLSKFIEIADQSVKEL